MRGAQFARLTAFVAVADYRSFTKAAASLRTSTPSLSQAVRNLEEEFGVRLLNRTTRSVALTEAGEQLREHLSPVIEGVGNAIDAISAYRDNPAGTLCLTVHPAAAVTVIAPLVGRFSAEYPAIHLEISVDDEPKDIVSERFDAGIHSGDDIAQDMIAAPIGGKFRLSTVASPDYLASRALPTTPEDLREHNCIRFRWTKGGAGHPWKFEKADQQVEMAVDGSLTVNDLDLALRAALQGVGIVQLPEAWVSSFVSEGSLIPLLDDWSPLWAGFVIYYSSRRHVPVKLRTLIDFLRKESKQFIPADAAA